MASFGGVCVDLNDTPETPLGLLHAALEGNERMNEAASAIPAVHALARGSTRPLAPTL